MKEIVKIVTSATIIFLMVGALQLYNWPLDYASSQEPTILSTPPDLWWMKGYTPGPNDYAWEPTGQNFLDAYHSNDSVLNDHLSMYFVNPFNNTIFIVIIELDPKIEDYILNIMKPTEGVTVKFLKGSASLKDLQKWQNLIFSRARELMDKGVIIHKADVSVNGTLLIGLEAMDDNKIEIIKNTFKEYLPLGILNIYEMGLIKEVMSNRDLYRPIIGGIREMAPNSGVGTTGFYVKYGSGIKGMITAGHCTNYPTNSTMYQPSNSDPQNRIGDTIARSPTSGNCYGDSALIRLDNGVSTAARIYNNTKRHDVIGKKSFYDMWVGNLIEMTGQTSGTLTGYIKYLGPLGYGNRTYWLQITASFLANLGDSGSPVYNKIYDSSEDAYNCTAYGTVHTISVPLHETYCNSISGMEIDLGQTFTFNDDGWSDDFAGLVRDPTIWSKLSVNNNGLGPNQGPPLRVLQLIITSGTGTAQCGYVTNKISTINHRYVEVEVTRNLNTSDVVLMICLTKVTGSNPYAQSNWYRCVKSRSGSNFYWKVERKVTGTLFSLESIASTSPTGKMRIAVDDGFIRFYENGALKYVEGWYFSTYDVYIYVYASATRSTSGQKIPYTDNFVYEPYDGFSWIDNFQDGLWADEWYLGWGNAAVENGVFKLWNNAEAYTYDIFNTERYVSVWTMTQTAGTQSWEVARVQAKYVDWDNTIYALIHKNGMVELCLRYQGVQTIWQTNPGNVTNPIGQWHQFQFFMSGDIVILKIDSSLKFFIQNPYFALLNSRAGVHTDGVNSVSIFDEVFVVY